jgi:uncharacterized protein (TIGR03067 family)
MKRVGLCTFACAAALLASCLLPAPAPPEDPDVPKEELLRLTATWQSTWKVVSWKEAGVEMVSPEDAQPRLVVFAPDATFRWIKGVTGKGLIIRIDPSKEPKEIDRVFTDGSFGGETLKAIYQLDGDTFTECYPGPGHARPTEFKSTKQNGWYLVVYKRIEKIDHDH